MYVYRRVFFTPNRKRGYGCHMPRDLFVRCLSLRRVQLSCTSRVLKRFAVVRSPLPKSRRRQPNPYLESAARQMFDLSHSPCIFCHAKLYFTVRQNIKFLTQMFYFPFFHFSTFSFFHFEAQFSWHIIRTAFF